MDPHGQKPISIFEPSVEHTEKISVERGLKILDFLLKKLNRGWVRGMHKKIQTTYITIQCFFSNTVTSFLQMSSEKETYSSEEHEEKYENKHKTNSSKEKIKNTVPFHCSILTSVADDNRMLNK